MILSPIEQGIKAKIEAVGTPLKDWDININRGILTGYNDAFIIDGKKKAELITLDPKSADIIRPILRERDIKRYSHEFADLWLIYIPWHFPLHNDPTVKGASLIAEQAFENQYPYIYAHLLKYHVELSNRNKSETGIRYEWYALQRWGANYWEDFSKQKIIWKIIGDQMAFSMDSSNLMVNNACYILTGGNLKYLLAVLNSRIIKWYSYLTNMNKTGVGDMQIGAQNVILFPIPRISDAEQKSISELVQGILTMKENNEETTKFEADIEILTYELYGLTKEEIAFIEAQ
ncbi:TaqI-like C-terminal specificity domain-containing protein [Albibacterium bauzanense]|uniref:TaqI-like C-terminal specificity domain-containing protein n=1 Tax=Albibacterium bauzanense TaxID=653929 RepID=UPI001C88AC2A|nr:TaqI-like C-terminal specificity domain-containing protein [Albibacterium bauzanense]